MEFQDFVCDQLARHHIILQNLCSKRWQLERGENLQGFEIKHDDWCTRSNRLSIEVAERSSRRVKTWTPSGIYRDDNAWLYIQGNYDTLFVFAKNWLQRYHTKRLKGRWDQKPTVRTFYLPMHEAREWAVRVIDVRMVAPKPTNSMRQALRGGTRGE
jgi:hypothetical protein